MKCREAHDIMNLVIDNEASPKEHSSLQFHIMGCPACKRLFDMSQDISVEMRNLSAPSPPSDLEEQVYLRLEKQALSVKPRKSPPYFIIAASLTVFILFTSFAILSNTNAPEYTAENIIEPESSLYLSALVKERDTLSNPVMFSSGKPETVMHLHGDKYLSMADNIKHSIRTAPPVRYTRQSCMISF